MISTVVVGTDHNMQKDYAAEIRNICKTKGIRCVERTEAMMPGDGYLILVGWRWLVETNDAVILVVFHDSLLPRCRGFNPLVTALINGDRNIGATCLLGAEEYDRGDILDQQAIEIEYPIKIEMAIEKMAALYLVMFENVVTKIRQNDLRAVAQDETKATYSLWRDADDYFIDWSWDAHKIERFINAVGHPYSGARAHIGNNVILLKSSFALPEDVVVENRQPGKVIFKKDGALVIVCGQGLLTINECFHEDGTNFPLENKFRIRFS